MPVKYLSMDLSRETEEIIEDVEISVDHLTKKER